MLAAQELEEPVLGVVRVLVLVHEDVAEVTCASARALREALEDLDGEHQQVVEVDRVRGMQATLVEVVRLRNRLVPEGCDAPGVVLG